MYGTDYPPVPDLDPWADPDEAQGDELTPGETWRAVDLEETLRGLQSGAIQRLRPTVGRLVDGRGLFYPRKVNGVAGASNCGKTWTALLASVQEIEAGRHVVYVDLEDDAAGVLERLLDLGADPAVILARFHYVHPDEPYGESAQKRLTELVEGYCATLVVVDSTGESLALDRARPNDDDDVARWFRRFPSRIASMGPAVVVLDHMTKADDGGLWPIGSQRKRAAITGAQYIQSTVSGFSKDTAGRAKLVCAKDRHGNYRPGQRVADLVVTPQGEHLASLWGHETPAAPSSDGRPVDLMERVSRALEDAAAPMTANEVNKAVTGGRRAVFGALDLLVTEGYANWTARGKSHLHVSQRPYRVADDPTRAQEPPDPLDGSPGWFGGSGSLKEGTREPPTNRFLEPPENHLGTTREAGAGDLDEPPLTCACGAPIGELRTAYGRTTCAGCERAS